jgi:hypothetical protein
MVVELPLPLRLVVVFASPGFWKPAEEQTFRVLFPGLVCRLPELPPRGSEGDS